MERIKETKIIPSEGKIKRFHTFLKDNKLYDEKTKHLICPECYYYAVKFSVNYYTKISKWRCERCAKYIIYSYYNLDLSDKDKYRIYKIWGIDALSLLTNKNIKETRKFVGSYFKDRCIAKEDKCPYFGILKK